MYKSNSSVIRGELCEGFCSVNPFEALSMSAGYSNCNHCIQYEKGECTIGLYQESSKFMKN